MSRKHKREKWKENPEANYGWHLRGYGVQPLQFQRGLRGCKLGAANEGSALPPKADIAEQDPDFR